MKLKIFHKRPNEVIKLGLSLIILFAVVVSMSTLRNLPPPIGQADRDF